MQTYNLRCGTVDEKELMEFLRSVDEEDCPLDDDGYADYVPYWSSDVVLAKASLAFPGNLIRLYVRDHEAYENENHWVDYWMDGKHQFMNAEIIYPEPSQEKWRVYPLETEV